MIRVTCAILTRHGKTLAALRSASMSHPLKWEFPGGKIEEGESPRECLQREIREELGYVIEVGEALDTVQHHYPGVSVELVPFLCRIVSGECRLLEHQEVKWLDDDELTGLDWAEADLPVLAQYLWRKQK